jgi:hypothetical protein
MIPTRTPFIGLSRNACIGAPDAAVRLPRALMHPAAATAAPVKNALFINARRSVSIMSLPFLGLFLPAPAGSDPGKHFFRRARR